MEKLHAYLPPRWVASIGIGLMVLAGTTAIALANLPGSTFEGNDGNLVVGTSGNTDWCTDFPYAGGTCVVPEPGLNVGIDLPSGSGDNSFGQGTKEDNAAVTVVSGSIPPNKSDLTRFYEASETVGGDTFLYLAWERTNVLGSANMDFEINRFGTPNLGDPGPHTIVRTAGDLLVTYDFTNGGTRPTLGLLFWVTTGSTSQCFSSNSLPCWGGHVILNAGDSEGAINTVTVTDPIAPNAPRQLAAFTFGEAAINLTASGVFPPGTCGSFGSAFLKSRSSASFNAEVKDFVAPIPVAISNCATVTTSLSANPVNVGVPVHDSATLTGVTSTAGGTVTYSVYSDSACTSLVANAGTKTVVNGIVPDSDNVTFNSVGTFYWQAAYSGDSHNTPGTSACTSETLVVNPVSPTISTTLSAGPINIGDSVHDSATLSGATSNAGGTVTYTVYSDNTCTTSVASAGTKTVTNGIVPDSDAVSFNSAGTFYWQAAYSGDANNNSAKSVCTDETLVVNPNKPGISTAQNLIPNDDATITGATSNAGGTITFNLYNPGDATCSGTADLTQTVNVSGNGTYSTTNTTFKASTEGTWRWKVVYSGDANNDGITLACGVESFTIKNS